MLQEANPVGHNRWLIRELQLCRVVKSTFTKWNLIEKFSRIKILQHPRILSWTSSGSNESNKWKWSLRRPPSRPPPLSPPIKSFLFEEQQWETFENKSLTRCSRWRLRANEAWKWTAFIAFLNMKTLGDRTGKNVKISKRFVVVVDKLFKHKARPQYLFVFLRLPSPNHLMSFDEKLSSCASSSRQLPQFRRWIIHAKSALRLAGTLTTGTRTDSRTTAN